MDILCTRCGEPWDVFSLVDDMSPEEAEELKAGRCCPCCKHTPDENLHNINPDGSHIQQALAGILGDDIDGLAASMEDFGLL